MPRVIAAHNRYRAGCGRAGPGRSSIGLAHPTAAITSFPLPQVGLPLSGVLIGSGMHIGQPQWMQGAKRTAAEPRRTENEWRRPPINKLHLTSQRGRKPRALAGLRIGLEDDPQFTGRNREFRVYSLTRFPEVAAYECFEAPIPRRLNELTRGLIPCR
jgi:hypothetical protein